MVRVSKLVSGILVASSLLVSSGVIAQADTPAAPNADSTANTTGTTDIQAMFKGNSSPVSQLIRIIPISLIIAVIVVTVLKPVAAYR
ncbi:hypothetical protein MRS59_15830 [Lactiplantibacillus plantarum]|nr:hypothetical protein [Lactiplantibacillus plantarum]MDI5787083.1 hypothetical protein [Lactiplantibacillus plantarum]